MARLAGRKDNAGIENSEGSKARFTRRNSATISSP